MIAVILNPASGIANHESMIYRLLGPGFDFFVTASEEEAVRLSTEQVEKENGMFILAAGDTLLDKVINKLMEEYGPGLSTMIGIIPVGTANNTAYNLGFESISDSCKLFRQFARDEKNAKDHVRKTDLMKVSFDDTVLYTVSSFNLGLLGRICHDVEHDNGGFLQRVFKKLRIKKVSYAANTIKSSADYQPFTADFVYDRRGALASFRLENLMNINLTNGRQQAAIKNWNPYGCPYDGELEIICAQEMNLGKMALTAGHMSLIGEHTAAAKKGTKFNRYGISYLDGIKTVCMSISEDDCKRSFYVELGGDGWPLKRLNQGVMVEVVPSAMNFVYKGHHR